MRPIRPLVRYHGGKWKLAPWIISHLPRHRALRTRAQAYRHEMTDADHEALDSALIGLRGMVVLSGYRCDLYDRLYATWPRVDVAAQADGAKARVESLWLSPNAVKQPTLLDGPC